MRMILLSALVCAIALLGGHAHAQQVGKLAVYVEANANDPIGRQLAFHLRDEIGRSGTFTEVGEDYDKGFRLVLVTLDPYDKQQNAGSSTIYSLVILGKGVGQLDYYLTSYVGSCITPKVCAANLFAGLGEQAELLRQALARR